MPEEPPKKKRKTGKSSADAKPATPVFDLVEPDLAQLKATSSSAGRPASSAATDVYGEATALPAADAADKMARKKSLRFHAARIESTAARRQNARSAAMGGDDDIPYRERKKEKEQRAAREAAKRRGAGGDDLDDAEPEARKAEKKRAREDDEGSGSEAGGDGDGYYELVQRQSKEKKEQKKAVYEAVKAAERCVFSCVVDALRVPELTHVSVCVVQTGRRRERGRPSLVDASHFEEQGPDAPSREECTQSPCQETAEIREGKEEGRVPEGGLQGRRLTNRGQIRRREDRNLTRREECPPVATRPRPSISLFVFLPYYRNPTLPHAHRTPVF